MKYNYLLKSESKKAIAEQFKRVLLYILVSISIIQQMPVIKDLYYNQLRAVLYVGFALFSVISFLKISKFIRLNFVRYWIYIITYSLAFFIAITISGSGSINIFELIIPFGILICSLNTEFSKRELSRFLIWYVLLSTLLGISSIFYYGKGFVITESYFLLGKNQIGPLIGISVIITFLWIFERLQFDLLHNSMILKIILLGLLMSSIIVIRNRSGLLGILIVFLVYIISKHKIKITKKKILIFYGISIVLLVIYLMGGIQKILYIIYKTFFLNYDSNDLNSISAGRIDGYVDAIRYISKYPLLGELGTNQLFNFSSYPHNYILYKLVKYGIIGSLPMILFYLYLWIFCFKHLTNRETKFFIPVWVLLFSLLVSMVEYTYPYGPGVSQLMLWILIGQYFRNNEKEFI